MVAGAGHGIPKKFEGGLIELIWGFLSQHQTKSLVGDRVRVLNFSKSHTHGNNRLSMTHILHGWFLVYHLPINIR